MKYLFVTLLTITAVAAEDIICEPGLIFKMDCNSCTCGPDGITAACTDMMCPEAENEDGSTNSTGFIYCTPGSQFKADCNSCTCGPDGRSAACTDMLCPEMQDKEANTKSERVCEPLSTFKNYCNTCYCSVDGSGYACTRMTCDPEIWNEDGTMKIFGKSHRVARSASKQVCKPRTQFKKYCNTCTCSIDGTEYACTRMACDPEIWNEDGTTKIVDESKGVAQPAQKQVCEPRTQFKKYCNTCTCSADGTEFACTRMACDPEIWNEDGTTKIVDESKGIAKPAQKQACKPRAQFKKYCNTCTCSADGTEYACTRMACDPEIWNEDGTTKVVDESMFVRKQVCQPNSIFIPDKCNICHCNKLGTSFGCTRKICV